mmetsp:Transcript_17735/g.41668  ORF Transcript_17735/g.41668 Transcript_17735/m.41668 type:complete len:239 (-) Transcript_17735:48-764(-)
MRLSCLLASFSSSDFLLSLRRACSFANGENVNLANSSQHSSRRKLKQLCSTRPVFAAMMAASASATAAADVAAAVAPAVPLEPRVSLLMERFNVSRSLRLRRSQQSTSSSVPQRTLHLSSSALMGINLVLMFSSTHFALLTRSAASSMHLLPSCTAFEAGKFQLVASAFSNTWVSLSLPISTPDCSHVRMRSNSSACCFSHDRRARMRFPTFFLWTSTLPSFVAIFQNCLRLLDTLFT